MGELVKVHQCAAKGGLFLGADCRPMLDACVLCGLPAPDGVYATSFVCGPCESVTVDGKPVGRFRAHGACVLLEGDDVLRVGPFLEMWGMWFNDLEQVTGGVFHVAVEDGNLEDRFILSALDRLSETGGVDYAAWCPPEDVSRLFGQCLLSWGEQARGVFYHFA